MNAIEIREQIQSRLMKAELEEALNLLIHGLDSPQQRHGHDHALMLKANWEDIKQAQLRGILSRSEYELATNKIIAGIQTITNDLDQELPGHNSNHTRPSPTPSSTKIMLATIIALLLGLSGWYVATHFGKESPVSATLPEKTAAPSPDEAAPKEVATSVKATNPNISPQEKRPPKSIPSKATENPPPTQTTVAPTVKPPVTAPVYFDIKVILTKSDVKLKVNGESPQYLGASSGMVRTIRIAAGKYKFEVVEDGISCTSEQEIGQTTQKIYPTCK